MTGRRPPLLHVAIDTGSGPLVVMLHGIASSSVTFERLVPLVEPHHRVIAIDLLGFGDSPAPDDAEYTIPEHVAALARTLRALRLRGPFVLVGHSMGALIASRYAATHRSRVSRLVIISPPIYLPVASLGGASGRTAMDLYFRTYEYLRENKEFTMRAASRLARLSPIKNLLDVSERNWRPFALSLQNSIETQTTLSDLAAVRVPVELIYGSLDPLLAPAGIQIVEQLRNVTTHRVEGGDHVIRNRLARVVATAIG
jgi:cis-3-alkyl-4-acyloxetan-2-one decarboxylase